ncbi:Zinc-binding alcohol dehydrogenase domain-containing protein 2 [Plakobranchus ocellatus]|uniref:Zinc-binding alcohol dehydrogenase domain-containing protein 2 n=1 Tax=Plakobranchus ocellatus TaxID=259542 RepID=A0AAV4DCS0_9GAST|nr:Zinc-binding alcohol dehydrogenase domain-containing protein 2 [Plakobranchus ocellatus]
MDKAARAVRRSSAKLLGGGHGDLHLLLSDVKEMRNIAKTFTNAQNAVAQDLLKWAVHEENRAVQDVANQLAELNLLWTEVQQEFAEHIKGFRHMFEMVLEGEKQVTQSKNNFATCEQREMKIRKELKKAFKKASSSEIQLLEGKLSQAERAKDLAQMEVTDRVRENEAVKLIRLKEGLMKLSQAYSDLGRKCVMVYDTQQDIVQQLPDVLDQDLENIKYTGSGITRYKVQQAKERVRGYRRSINAYNAKLSEPPPPYSLNNDNDDDVDKESYSHSSSCIYPSLVMNSPRRRVSDTLNYSSQGSPLLQDSTLAPFQAALPMATTTETTVQETSSPPPNHPSQCLPAHGIDVLPSAMPPLSFDPSISSPSPRPAFPLAQAAAVATTASSTCAISKTPKHVGISTATLGQESLQPSESQYPCSFPPHSIDEGFNDKLLLKEDVFKDEISSPLRFSTTLSQLGGGKQQGSHSGVQALQIVDFNPDWDTNYEEDLSMAVGGTKISSDEGS